MRMLQDFENELRDEMMESLIEHNTVHDVERLLAEMKEEPMHTVTLYLYDGRVCTVPLSFNEMHLIMELVRNGYAMCALHAKFPDGHKEFVQVARIENFK